MESFKFFAFIGLIVMVIGVCAGNPAKPAFWKGTPLDNMVEEMRSNCADGSDAISCMKFKVLNFLDAIFKKDTYQVAGMEFHGNGLTYNDEQSRSTTSVFDKLERYVESHDVSFDVPIADAKITVSPKHVNEDELNVKIKFNENESRSAAEPRKSKLKKVIIPIMVFVLLKAMTLIPLALGVLGLKAWNALQLSFFSFVTSLALAVFQLCKKLAIDNHHPQIAAHGPWDGRTFTDENVPQNEGNDMAYKAYN